MFNLIEKLNQSLPGDIAFESKGLEGRVQKTAVNLVDKNFPNGKGTNNSKLYVYEKISSGTAPNSSWLAFSSKNPARSKVMNALFNSNLDQKLFIKSDDEDEYRVVTGCDVDSVVKNIISVIRLYNNDALSDPQINAFVNVPKKGRGRPRKNVVTADSNVLKEEVEEEGGNIMRTIFNDDFSECDDDDDKYNDDDDGAYVDAEAEELEKK